MIKYVEGDILKTKADAIVHGIAPNDDFKQGLALSLRENWPSLYKDFRHFCKTQSPKEGEVWSWKGPGGPVVFNLMTQDAPKTKNDHPGKASMTHLHHAFKNLKKELATHEVKSIAITKIATGVGGLDWDEVKPELEASLKELEIPVYVYETYHKDMQAQE